MIDVAFCRLVLEAIRPSLSPEKGAAIDALFEADGAYEAAMLGFQWAADQRIPLPQALLEIAGTGRWGGVHAEREVETLRRLVAVIPVAEAV